MAGTNKSAAGTTLVVTTGMPRAAASKAGRTEPLLEAWEIQQIGSVVQADENLDGDISGEAYPILDLGPARLLSQAVAGRVKHVVLTPLAAADIDLQGHYLTAVPDCNRSFKGRCD